MQAVLKANEASDALIEPMQLFKCLSDETRLSLVLLIHAYRELCVCDLVCALNTHQPKISRHLAQLRECGLLIGEKHGQWVYYRLHDELPNWATSVIEQAAQASVMNLRVLKERLGNPSAKTCC